ncbi:unnamed protein product [Closterium sp. NIES-54]
MSGLYLPSFSTNLVSGADLQDQGVDQFTPASQRVTHCTCARTGRHLATFTRWPGSSLYTLTTASPPVAESGQVVAAASRSGPGSAPCSCRLLSHQTLLWHHRLGHPSLPRLRGKASRVLRAAPHSSEFPPTEAPLQTLHMDVWGLARVRGQGHERYFLLAVDDYSRYTTVFSLRSKGDVTETFTLLASPQQNGIAERRIGVVMDVARTSMIHAAAPHFLWPFAVQYTAHQLNLQPRVSLPETSPTLRWTGKVSDASAFQVWGSRAFVRDLSADKLSPRAVPCVFLGFPPDVPGWQFYHPTSCRVLSSQDVTFNESVPYYRLFPYRTAPLPPPQLFLAPGPPPVDPFPPQGPAPSGVSQVDAVEPVEVAVDSGAARGAEPAAAGSRDAEPEGAEPGGTESRGAEPGGAKPGGLAERREPVSRPASPVRAARTSRRAPRPHPPAVPGTHQMALRPSTAPLRVPLPSPPESSLPVLADPESDSLCAACSTVLHLLATAVTDPSFESTAASALVAELFDFAACCRLDYAASLVSEFASVCPPSVGGECALSTDVLEDRQEEFQCFAAALPHPVSTLLAPEGDPDAPDIPTPRSYAEAIEGPFSCQWQAAMDAEMASWKSTGTYIDEVPPPGANIVSGMWIFRVKRPPGSPPVFKARYVARGFSEQQGVDYFHTFSLTPKMTTLRVLLHVAAQRDYELHSLDFSTAFLQGSLHEEIWLRRPPGFTGSFPAGTQWSLRRPVYGLRQAPREWHDTLRTTLAALGFAPSTADPSLFLRIDTLLPPFYILVYVDDLVFATADTAGLAHVKSELQKRHTCTDLGELRSYLGLRITRDRARCTITLTQSHMVQQLLQRFDFTYSSPQATSLSTRHSLSALPSDESVEPSGPYPGLVGCLMYLMTCTRPDLAFPLSILARYVAPGRYRPEHMAAAKRVLRYFCSTSGLGLVLGGQSPVVLTGRADASWVDDLATQRSSQGYTFSLGSGSIPWRSTRSSSVLSSSCEAEIYAGAMAAQELRWLTYLLTDLGEPPRSPPVLYVDNKAMLALCREHRLEHRTKHIALRYFLARELQKRGQLRLAYVASQANTADIFTKALQPCDHQRFCTMLVGRAVASERMSTIYNAFTICGIFAVISGLPSRTAVTAAWSVTEHQPASVGHHAAGLGHHHHYHTTSLHGNSFSQDPSQVSHIQYSPHDGYSHDEFDMLRQVESVRQQREGDSQPPPLFTAVAAAAASGGSFVLNVPIKRAAAAAAAIYAATNTATTAATNAATTAATAGFTTTGDASLQAQRRRRRQRTVIIGPVSLKWAAAAAGYQPSRKRPKGPCTSLERVFIVRVKSAADFAARASLPPTTTVILYLQKDLTLPQGVLFQRQQSCTILMSAKWPGYTLTGGNPMYPVLRVWNTSNVVSLNVNYHLTVTESSPECTTVPELGKAVTCPAISIHRSYGVQIGKGNIFGRVDVLRSMSVRLDSLTVTGVASFNRSPGVIRVALSGYGPGLLKSNIVISNNEVYGVNTPILLHKGAVGVTVTNNYVHDYIFAGIKCGADVHYSFACMLARINSNLVICSGRNLNGDHDSAGIYFYTHWFSPGNSALCNYVFNGDHCYYLDHCTSGVLVRGGACVNTYDGMKVNNGKRNVIESVAMKGTQGSLGWTSCFTVTVNNCLKDPGNYWEAMCVKYYNSALINLVSGRKAGL